MNSDNPNPEEAMTFGELLALIADQQRRLSVLEDAFSHLSLCLDENATRRLAEQLHLQAGNPEHDEAKQHHFAVLANALVRPAE